MIRIIRIRTSNPKRYRLKLPLHAWLPMMCDQTPKRTWRRARHLGFIGFIGFIGFKGLEFIGFMGFIGFKGLGA